MAFAPEVCRVCKRNNKWNNAEWRISHCLIVTAFATKETAVQKVSHCRGHEFKCECFGSALVSELNNLSSTLVERN